MKKYILLIIAIAFILAGNVHAQIKNPVSWQWEMKQISSTEAELIFTATIENKWHIYATEIDGIGPIPTSVEFDKSKDFALSGKITEITKPHVKYDSSFGINLGSHSKKAVFGQKIKIKSEKDFDIKGYVTSQACNDVTCIAPQDVDFVFHVSGSTQTSNPIVGPDTVIAADTQATIAVDTMKTIVPLSNETAVAEKDSIWKTFWIAFGWGLLALLMPCVFPLIPMTVSFFLKSSEQKAKARFNAIVFSTSIVVIFFILGVLFSLLFGAGFANALSTHWSLNIFLFVIFMVFAASFFGMFEIVLPSSWVNFTDKHAEKGGFIGPFFMAFTTVLVSFSCTVPIIGAVLFSSMHGEFGSAIIKMLGFSLAIALPFGFFAFFPNMLHSLPKSGSWMNTLKVVLGFLELALGLKFLSIVDLTYHWHILNREVFIAIWIVVFTLMGFYLLGKIKFAHDSDSKKIGVPRLLTAIITFSFVVYLIPGMIGAPLKLLSGYLPPLTRQSFVLGKTFYNSSQKELPTVLCDKPKYSDILEIPLGLEGYFDYNQAIECARKQNKPLFVDFTGHGCANCRKMEEKVWSDPAVLEKLRNNFIIVSLYVDDKTTLPEAEWYKSTVDGKVKNTIGKKWTDFIISKYNVNAQPYYIILGPDENLLIQPKGLDLNVDNFINFLDQAVSQYNVKFGK
jgi:thiol:disulfide interchange protein